MFCVAKKWWNIRPLNSDGTSNEILVHWASHFKGLYDTKEIPLLLLMMSENHLRNIHCNHILKHAGNNFLYFDYDHKNKRSYCIKSDKNARKAGSERQLTKIKSNTKAIRDKRNQAQPDMSVHQIRF